MKIIILAAMAFILVVSVGMSKAESGSADQANEIRAVYQKYTTAAMSKTGRDIASIISPESINYYDRILLNVRTATRSELEKLPVEQKMMVLMFRHRMSSEQLAGFDGLKIITHSLEQGWVSPESFQNLSIGSVEVFGNHALAYLNDKTSPTSGVIEFGYYGAEWRLELSSLIEPLGAILPQMAQQMGVTIDELIFRMLQSSTGIAPTEKIWFPSDTQD